MATTHNVGSSKSLAVGKHDGHIDGHLNCVALRHGWSRTFSISPSELLTLDYDTLSSILEIHTLKLRPMGVRIYVENPPESNQWSKIKYWKNDGSLQATLVLEFFERRRVSGTIMRVDVRDGHDRDTGDGMSLKSVTTLVLKRKASASEGGDRSATASPAAGSKWFGLNRNTSVRSRTRAIVATNTDGEEEEEAHEQDEEEERAPPTPPKPSFFSLLRPHPQLPNTPHKRRSIFEFLRDKLSNKPNTVATTNANTQRNATRNKGINPFASITSRTNPFSRNPFASLTRLGTTTTNNHAYETTDQEDNDQEVEVLRKRGWIPPGLIRRQKSLRERLGKDDGTVSRNPFFGSKGSGLSRAERRGKNKAVPTNVGETDLETDADADPFGDHHEHAGAEELTEADVDNFFEIERTESMVEMENRPSKDKPFSRFRNSKDRKQAKRKGSGNTVEASPEEAVKPRLGSGADIVQRPRDAFPDSGHKFVEDVA